MIKLIMSDCACHGSAGYTKTTDWIQTYKGFNFYPLEPDARFIDIEDIAHSLTNICRFNGHSNRFYSVAEHSMNCLYIARQMGLSYADRYAALMHDAAEAYLSDIPRPVKRFITGYAEAEKKLEADIAEKFELQYPWSENVHKIDNIMLATERRDLFNNPATWGSLTEEPSIHLKICGVPPHPVILKDSFIRQFYELRKALLK